ncbi:MAG: PLD nuclease N-terminal domain-containing protein [Planctomycetota bacterium]
MLDLIAQTNPLLTLAQNSGGDAAAAGFGIVFILAWCCFMIFGLALLGFWIWMLIDCAQRDFPGDNDKLIWILVIVLAGAIGALIYYFVGRPKGTKK